jgi:hypothetical protein
MPKYSKLERYDGLMGKVSDPVIAQMAGTTTEAVRARRIRIGKPAYTPPPAPSHQDALALLIPFLGLYPAAMLASAVNVPLQQVSKLIKSLGVTPYQQPRPDIPSYDHLQGKQPDQELADVIGCSKEAVRLRRVRLGIESYRGKTRRTSRGQ